MVKHLVTRERAQRRPQQGHQKRTYRLVVEALETRLVLSDMVLRWNSIALAAIRTAAQNPVDATRTLAIVQAAVYDAVNSIDQSYTPYLANIPAPSGASEDAAVAQAAHDVLLSLFSTQPLPLDSQLKATLQTIPEGDAKNAGIQVGQMAAQAILAARANDGANKTVDYTPGTNPGDWQPTPPAYAAAFAPQWGMVTPFTLQSGSQFRPPPPPALDSAEYTAAFNEVKAVGSFDSTTRTADQTEAALFWQGIVTPNSTTAGEWNQIAQQVAVAKGNTLVQNARLFALLDLTAADAAIACWDAKYTYNFWRPVTAIRAADTDSNPDTEADPNWTPLFPTPSHPSYPSGHSTVSGGSAVVLASFFGSDAIPFTLSFEGLPGVARSFAGFKEAEIEAGMARIWAGIHYRFDIDAGQPIGEAVGAYVFQNFLQPRTSPPPARSAAPILVTARGTMGEAAGFSTSVSGLATATGPGTELRPLNLGAVDTGSGHLVSEVGATAISRLASHEWRSPIDARSADDVFASADSWEGHWLLA